MIIGSFLNVCIYRIPEGKSINFPRSHCMKCGHVLGPQELVPVLSYLALGGKCKSCKASISPRYMCIEILTGIGFGTIYTIYGTSSQTIFHCIFLSFMIVLTMIDWDHMILPTRIIMWGTGFTLIIKLIEYSINREIVVLLESILGGLAGFLIFWLLYKGSIMILKKEGLGYGDVRLMGLLGLYIGIDYIFLMIIIACIVASIFGIIFLAINKESRPFPLGPFLNLGAFIIILYGDQILTLYMHLCNKLYGPI